MPLRLSLSGALPPVVLLLSLTVGCGDHETCERVSSSSVCREGDRVVAIRDAGPTPHTAMSSPFRCAGDECVQRFPLLPDDGEWECAELGGAVVCRGGTAAAGVRAGAPSDAFRCRPLEDRRICVDLSPERPAGGYRCHFEHHGSESRICTRDARPNALLAPCDATHPCELGLHCELARCVPPLPTGSPCWTDHDCATGHCVLASCEGT